MRDRSVFSHACRLCYELYVPKDDGLAAAQNSIRVVACIAIEIKLTC